MADDFVYGRADRLGEVAVVQGGGVRIAVDGSLVHDGINLVGGDTRADGSSSDVQDLPTQLYGAQANTGSGQKERCSRLTGRLRAGRRG